MATVTMDVQLRDVLGKKVKRLRKQGLLPATVYGKGIEPVAIQIDDRTFNTTYRRAGRTTLIELNIPGQRRQSAYVQTVQRHPVTRTIIHAEFRVVDLTIETTIAVPIVFTGESPLVKRGDGLLNHGINSVEVHGLPAALPQHIEVDVSVLDSFDKNIHVRDLPPGQGYSYVTDGDELIASLVMLRAEEEQPVAADTESVEPELIRRSRREEEEEG